MEQFSERTHHGQGKGFHNSAGSTWLKDQTVPGATDRPTSKGPPFQATGMAFEFTVTVQHCHSMSGLDFVSILLQHLCFQNQGKSCSREPRVFSQFSYTRLLFQWRAYFPLEIGIWNHWRARRNEHIFPKLPQSLFHVTRSFSWVNCSLIIWDLWLLGIRKMTWIKEAWNEFWKNL